VSYATSACMCRPHTQGIAAASTSPLPFWCFPSLTLAYCPRCVRPSTWCIHRNHLSRESSRCGQAHELSEHDGKQLSCDKNVSLDTIKGTLDYLPSYEAFFVAYGGIKLHHNYMVRRSVSRPRKRSIEPETNKYRVLIVL
jgi:hypothetical protein